ncbi:MAG: hypothetical protein ABII00_03460 [Elusimicrobiota bacterium]
MNVPLKTCLYCHRRFEPDPRTAAFQKACKREACRRERRRRKWQSWHKRHPDYRKGEPQRNKKKAWAKTYPDYWKAYRAGHGEYRKRERRRMAAKRRRTQRVANPTARRKTSVEKLCRIRARVAPGVAKPTAIARRMGEVVDYLLWKEGVAKPTDIAYGGGAGR